MGVFSTFFRSVWSPKEIESDNAGSTSKNAASQDGSSSTIKGTLYDESSLDEHLAGVSKQQRESIKEALKHLDRSQALKLLNPGYLACLGEIGDAPEMADIFFFLSSPIVSPKVKDVLLDAATVDGFRKLSIDSKRNVIGMLHNKALDEEHSLEVLNPDFFRGLSRETQNIASSLLANKHISMSVQKVVLDRSVLTAFDVLPSEKKHEFFVNLAKGLVPEETAVNFLLRTPEQTSSPSMI